MSTASFSFSFYGLDVSVKSDLVELGYLIKKKFAGWNSMETTLLANGAVNISTIDDITIDSSSFIKLSSDVYYSQNQLFVTHEYLTTKTKILYTFSKNTLSNIEVSFHRTAGFYALNKLYAGMIQYQLFQNLVSQYIEQPLLFEIAKKKNLTCLHASAVEKDNKVWAFVGLNGVGKSTLAQYLISQNDFHLFADNYLLTDSTHAYFSPDVVRLDRASLKAINIQEGTFFGFNKFQVSESDLQRSSNQKAKIEKVFIVQRGSTWSSRKLSHKSAQGIISHMQTQHREEISKSVTSQFYILNQTESLKPSWPDCQYSLLTIANLKDFSMKLLT